MQSTVLCYPTKLLTGGRRVLKGIVCAVVTLLAASGGAAQAQSLADANAAVARGNYARAARIFFLLARTGHPEAEYRLALLYGAGTGVPQDYVLQAAWCHDAAEQGHLAAQLTLARLYGRGIGVPQDDSLAYMWANLAAARLPHGPELDAAIQYRELIKYRLAMPQLLGAQQIAAYWRPKPPNPPLITAALPPPPP